MCLAAAGTSAARGVPLLAAEVYSRMSRSLGQLDRTCSMICMALARQRTREQKECYGSGSSFSCGHAPSPTLQQLDQVPQLLP